MKIGNTEISVNNFDSEADSIRNDQGFYVWRLICAGEDIGMIAGTKEWVNEHCRQESASCGLKYWVIQA